MHRNVYHITSANSFAVSPQWFHTVGLVTLIDELWFLRPTRHKIGQFGDVPQANLLAWYGKTKSNTTKHTFTNQKKHKKLNPGLVASYDIRPGNGEGPFWFWCFINLSLKVLWHEKKPICRALITSYSSLGTQVRHVLTRNDTVLPDTHMFIHNRNESYLPDGHTAWKIYTDKFSFRTSRWRKSRGQPSNTGSVQ